MHDEIAPAVAGGVNDVVVDLDAAERRTAIIAHSLLVIAGNVDDAATLPHLAKQLLQHVVMRLQPDRAALHSPEIDDVADQVDSVGVMMLEEVEEGVGLRGAGAQMDVGDEKRFISHRIGFVCWRENVVAVRDSHSSNPNFSRRGKRKSVAAV